VCVCVSTSRFTVRSASAVLAVHLSGEQLGEGVFEQFVHTRRLCVCVCVCVCLCVCVCVCVCVCACFISNCSTAKAQTININVDSFGSLETSLVLAGGSLVCSALSK